MKELISSLNQTAELIKDEQIKELIKTTLNKLEKKNNKLSNLIDNETISNDTITSIYNSIKNIIFDLEKQIQPLLNNLKSTQKNIVRDILNNLRGKKGILLLEEELLNKRKLHSAEHQKQLEFEEINEIVEKIIKEAEQYKNKNPNETDQRYLMEFYGFALALSQITINSEHQKLLHSKSGELIEKFVGRVLNKPIGTIAAINLPENISTLKSKLDNLRLSFDMKKQNEEKQFDLLRKNFGDLFKDIFKYALELIGQPPKDCRYIPVGLGSWATERITPYSDVEYFILVEPYRDKVVTYFKSLAHIIELILVSLGESPIIQAKAALEKYRAYFNYLPSGLHLDEHKQPQDNNRKISLVNSPQEIIEQLTAKDSIIHKAGNHLTSALFTTKLFEGLGDEKLYQTFQQLFNKALHTQDYANCLKELLKQDIKSCEGLLTAELDNPWKRKQLHHQIDVKQLLIPLIHLPRQLLLLSKAVDEPIELEHQKLKATLDTLFLLRLKLQKQNNSAKAIMSLEELNKNVSVEEVIEVLKELKDKVIKYIDKELKKQLPKLTTVLDTVIPAEKLLHVPSLNPNSVGEIELLKSLHKIYQDKAYTSIADLFDDENKVMEIEKFYVKLSLITEEDQIDKEKEKEKLRENEISTVAEHFFTVQKSIELNDIFTINSASKPSENSKTNRILITGYSGAGKSTLCQYIAYQWSLGKLWPGQYLAVFRIQLRNLIKDYYPDNLKRKYTLLDIIKRECFNDQIYGVEKTQLKNIIESNKNNYLLVLDGYDELSSQTEDKHLIDLVHQWLKYSAVIVTSRPQIVSQFSADKKFEIMGFTSADILKYIDRHFSHNMQAGENLKQQLRQQPLLSSLSHIPLNLGLVCQTWEHDPWLDEITLTELYEKLLRSLGRRFLKKYHQDYKRPGKQTSLNELLDIGIENLCKDWLTILEEIAWKMCKENKIYFKYDEIMNDEIDTKKREWSLEQLRLSGLVRLTTDKKFYYFIHSTFQEFFSARNLAKDITDYENKVDSLFKIDHLFNYINMWKFLAGLLIRKKPNDLDDLFKRIFKLRSRIIDLKQIYLVSNCLEEIRWPENINHSKLVKEKIVTWLDNYFNDRFFGIKNEILAILKSCPSLTIEGGLFFDYFQRLLQNEIKEVSEKRYFSFRYHENIADMIISMGDKASSDLQKLIVQILKSGFLQDYYRKNILLSVCEIGPALIEELQIEVANNLLKIDEEKLEQYVYKTFPKEEEFNQISKIGIGAKEVLLKKYIFIFDQLLNTKEHVSINLLNILEKAQSFGQRIYDQLSSRFENMLIGEKKLDVIDQLKDHTFYFLNDFRKKHREKAKNNPKSLRILISLIWAGPLLIDEKGDPVWRAIYESDEVYLDKLSEMGGELIKNGKKFHEMVFESSKMYNSYRSDEFISALTCLLQEIYHTEEEYKKFDSLLAEFILNIPSHEYRLFNLVIEAKNLDGNQVKEAILQRIDKGDAFFINLLGLCLTGSDNTWIKNKLSNILKYETNHDASLLCGTLFTFVRIKNSFENIDMRFFKNLCEKYPNKKIEFYQSLISALRAQIKINKVENEIEEIIINIIKNESQVYLIQITMGLLEIKPEFFTLNVQQTINDKLMNYIDKWENEIHHTHDSFEIFRCILLSLRYVASKIELVVLKNNIFEFTKIFKKGYYPTLAEFSGEIIINASLNYPIEKLIDFISQDNDKLIKIIRKQAPQVKQELQDKLLELMDNTYFQQRAIEAIQAINLNCDRRLFEKLCSPAFLNNWYISHTVINTLKKLVRSNPKFQLLLLQHLNKNFLKNYLEIISSLNGNASAEFQEKFLKQIPLLLEEWNHHQYKIRETIRFGIGISATEEFQNGLLELFKNKEEDESLSELIFTLAEVCPPMKSKILSVSNKNLYGFRSRHYGFFSNLEVVEVCLQQKLLHAFEKFGNKQSCLEKNLINSEQSSMITKAQNSGYTVINIERDGNGFFHTFVEQLQYLHEQQMIDIPGLPDLSYKSLSEYLVKHIADHESDYLKLLDPTDGYDLIAFVEKLNQGGEWANKVIMNVLSQAFNISIEIIRSDSDVSQQNTETALYVVYITSEQYLLLLKLSDGKLQKDDKNSYRL